MERRAWFDQCYNLTTASWNTCCNGGKAICTMETEHDQRLIEHLEILLVLVRSTIEQDTKPKPAETEPPVKSYPLRSVTPRLRKTTGVRGGVQGLVCSAKQF
ncbi:uncharacterized protein LOC129751126 [Uranotaenia lowii]|uniref:uncharacterized protein LOC129751126 n=1 Tax=Uranotaenia lowii TaxID=190385 RepID=UPI002478B9DA|nr:uncharacterized protein LOC129751126 [Uranotaenia lowii]